jgi:hypothetical protein
MLGHATPLLPFVGLRWLVVVVECRAVFWKL